MPRNLNRGSNQSFPQQVHSEIVVSQQYLTAQSLVRVVVGAECQLGRHESESTLGKGKGKTGKTQITVVGSIVVTDDYSWGPSGTVAHCWTHANKINHRKEEAECKAWCLKTYL